MEIILSETEQIPDKTLGAQSNLKNKNAKTKIPRRFSPKFFKEPSCQRRITRLLERKIRQLEKTTHNKKRHTTRKDTNYKSYWTQYMT